MIDHTVVRAARTTLLAATVLSFAIPAAVTPSLAQKAPASPTPNSPAQTSPATGAGPESVADLAEGLLGAVVNISTSQTVKGTDGPGAVPMPQLPEGSPFQDFFDEFFKDRGGPRGGGSQKVQSLGSGFVIDAKEGFVVTNNHVIADADDIEVNFSDGLTLKATLVGTDTKTDIALLKVDPADHKLTEVKFGDSDKMRIGDWVMAIGNPFGLGGTVTVGIISARNRDINAGPYDDFIQTDAAINRGNSGGPLFNMHGVVDQLREFGETRRGWLGVRIQPVTEDIAESLGMKEAKGALIAGIMKGGPVDDGSIQPGDVVTKFDGKEIDEVRDLPRIVAESPVGKAVDVVLVRKGKEMTVKVTLGRLEDSEKVAEGEDDEAGQQGEAVATASVLGMTIGELDEAARSKFGIAEGVNGVVVTEVAPDSAAAERGVQAGEVITEIAQESVANPTDVVDRIAALKEQGRKNALLMMASKSGELRFVTIRMD
jgi:serine protease Do